MDNKRQLVTSVSVDTISNECCPSASASQHHLVPQPRGLAAGHSTHPGSHKMKGEQAKMNHQETQMKFNYGKFRTAYQKMRLKAGSYLLGRLPTRFYSNEDKTKKK